MPELRHRRDLGHIPRPARSDAVESRLVSLILATLPSIGKRPPGRVSLAAVLPAEAGPVGDDGPPSGFASASPSLPRRLEGWRHRKGLYLSFFAYFSST